MNNKTIIVTGANGSIGKEIVIKLVKLNYNVIMACRNTQKAEIIKDDILKKTNSNYKNNIYIQELDLSSFSSINNFVKEIIEKKTTINGLINNAAIINREFSTTPEGIENTTMVNYISVAMLSKLIIPLMPIGSSITNVVSITSGLKKIDKDFFNQTEQNYSQLGSYSSSKAALMIFTSSLSELCKDKIYVNAADPGIVDTNIITLNRWFDPIADIFFRPFIKSANKGSTPIVNALLSSDTEYIFKGNKQKPINTKFKNHKLKDWLYLETDKIINTSL